MYIIEITNRWTNSIYEHELYIFRIYHKDYFTDRIEEGEIDPRIASIPTRLDEAAEQLVRKHILDRLRSVYQVTYRHPSKLITYRNDINS